MAKEEYTIVEDDQDIAEREFNDALQELFGFHKTQMESGLDDRRREFFALKKKEFRQNKADKKAIFSNKIVKNLYELGEINLTDAIDLEFFASLNDKDRMAWVDQIDDEIGYQIADLARLNTAFAVNIPEIATNFSLANDLIARAKTVVVDKQKYDSMTKAQKNEFACKNKQTNMSLANSIMDSLINVSQSFCRLEQNYSLAEAVMLRKDIARSLMTNVNRMCHYTLITNRDSFLLDYKTIKFLRNGVSHDNWAEAKNHDKKMSKLYIDITDTFYNQLKASAVKTVEMSKN